jgi:flagellar hook-basal body complex protein FliE
MPIDSIGALSGLPAVAPTSPTSAALPTAAVAPSLPGTSGATSPDAVAGAQAADFGTALAGQVDALQGMQGERDTLSLQAVTGDLQDIHEATIAAAEASATMDLMVALRNTSLQAFNELMRIQA